MESSANAVCRLLAVRVLQQFYRSDVRLFLRRNRASAMVKQWTIRRRYVAGVLEIREQEKQQEKLAKEMREKEEEKKKLEKELQEQKEQRKKIVESLGIV